MTARKTCSKCKENKPLAMFSKNRARKDGLQNKCKACGAAYYAANRERYTACNAAWRAANKEKRLAYAAARRAVPRNRAAARATSAAWYAENRDYAIWTRSQNKMLNGG